LKKGEIKVTFERIIEDKGIFITKTEDGKEVTVSISGWDEDRLPKPFESLVLDDVTQKRTKKGKKVWRAARARFFKITEE